MKDILTYGELPLLLSEQNIRMAKKGELDELTFDVLTNANNIVNDLRELGIERGKRLGNNSNFWVDTWSEKIEGLEAEVAISCVGVQDFTRRFRVLSVGSQNVSIGPIAEYVLVWNEQEHGAAAESGLGGNSQDPPPEDQESNKKRVYRRVEKLNKYGEVINKKFSVGNSGTSESANVTRNTYQITDTYYVQGALPPLAGGVQASPPNPPQLPPDPFAGWSGKSRLNHPNGWVLVSKTPEEIFAPIGGIGLYKVVEQYEYRYMFEPE